MKVIELPEFEIDSLVLAERDWPEPGPGQVLVKFAGFSLNYRDFLIAKGLYNPNIALPVVPLSDGAGNVVAVGDGVTRVGIGDLVTPLFFPKWVSGPATSESRAQSGGCDVLGTLREYGVYDQDAVAKATPSKRGGSSLLSVRRPHGVAFVGHGVRYQEGRYGSRYRHWRRRGRQSRRVRRHDGFCRPAFTQTGNRRILSIRRGGGRAQCTLHGPAFRENHDYDAVDVRLLPA